MRRAIPPYLLLNSALILFAAVAGFAADDAKEVPLRTVYTTTGQKNTQNARPDVELQDIQEFGHRIPQKPAICLVNGKNCRTAAKVSHPLLNPAGEKKEAPANPMVKAAEDAWVGAFLGNAGSSPPAFRVLSVETKGKQVRVKYEFTPPEVATGDVHQYFVWAPLGKLTAGEYTLELYNAVEKKVTATGKCKVVAD